MKAIKALGGGRIGLVLGAILLLLASPLVAPQLLAFPYKAQAGNDVVWSERPIDEAALGQVMRRADALLSASAVAGERQPARIFLTDGGWRWKWLATSSSSGFALTRALTDPVILVNRSDIAADRVTNGFDIAGERSLSAVIAHEATHQMLRRRYGVVEMASKPQWLVEGYADHVARESSLSPEEVAAMEKAGEDHPALPYFHGRKRVAELLSGNGGDVDALFLGPVPDAP